ncbi:MAG TPA: hypothetical protein VF741_07365 [Candidatus Aquilonibacter sp.]
MIGFTGLLLAAAMGASPLQPQLTPGAHYSNIFSICIAFSLDGQKDETVFRNSGSATYLVNRVDAQTANLTGRGQYDGRAVFDGAFDVDLGTHNVIKDGKQIIDTDSSGFLYNPFMWGDPRATLALGATWNVMIPRAWELGPAGTQKVTVLAIDPNANSVTLQRDGSGSGAALDDTPRAFNYNGDSIKGTIAPDGPATWHGISTFANGIVMSDSILVTRNVRVTLANGTTVAAHERLYTLVAAVPGDT